MQQWFWLDDFRIEKVLKKPVKKILIRVRTFLAPAFMGFRQSFTASSSGIFGLANNFQQMAPGFASFIMFKVWGL